MEGSESRGLGEGRKKGVGTKRTFHRASLSSKARNEYFIGRSVHQQICQESKCLPANRSIFGVQQQREITFRVEEKILPTIYLQRQRNENEGVQRGHVE